ncbi:putative efflux protein, MATE family [Clostridium cavendishii DSM 21758]|uniref:Probable multidrug resistance protein NorM n=1 Tax=Clostridium cavendishii DSM 21758 TaxID=1121302 RepID=A0A1M6HQB5_9CLOT|nr:MATE family efflux transporter [Clostridium cavendishii]SHJ24395.1 putative efflux protein, MATE family [Clostridium cavendishii DSM 21758]
MKNREDLVNGSIVKSLIKLSIPIMGTSFIQMAYNMIDMIWLGRLGSKAVAGVGTASFFTWFGMSLVFVSKVGAEIGVAQSVGSGDEASAKEYVKNSIQLNIILGIVYGLFMIVFRKQLIGFFNLGDEEVIDMAYTFLVIIAVGTNFNFINPLLTGICNGGGDSKTPFKINTLGLIFNIVADPFLIFGIGPFPALGVKGAAIATVLAQVLVTICFIYSLKNRTETYFKVKLLKKLNPIYLKKICKLGVPVSLQNGLFSFFAMCIARVISGYGPTAIAVQKVGAQIEAISWMTAGGFSTALSAFVGQNFGANKWKRIYKGYYATLGIASCVGIITTLLLVFGGGTIFKFFIPESEAIRMGTVYLIILGYSQLFMCIEITTTGAFNGLGKTIYPSIVSIIFTGLRVPAAIYLATPDRLGLNGVWWSISLSSVLKGVILTSLFAFMVLLPNKKRLIEESSAN